MKIFRLKPCLLLLCVLFCSFLCTAQPHAAVNTTAPIPLADALRQISLHYKVNFLYDQSNISGKKVVLKVEDMKEKRLEPLLNILLAPTGLCWSRMDAANYTVFPAPDESHTSSLEKSTQAMQHAEAANSEMAIISGLITDGQQGVEFSTLVLLQASDSAFVKSVLSDTAGAYLFTDVKAGQYILKASSIGYEKATLGKFAVSAGASLKMQPIIMQPLSATLLNEVEITASQPLVQRRDNGYVLNLENRAMTTGNSIQLLRSAPFVEVSPDNEVSLQGKKTMILIDNRPVATAALDDILQTLPAGTISQVELITNPSARYDAAYGAVINIITRKNEAEGTTANLRAEGSQGDFGRLNLNGRLTYKNKGLTLFGMGGYNRFNFQTHDQLERKLRIETPAFLIEEEITRTFYQDIYSFQAGSDLEIGKSQRVGLLVEGQVNRTAGTFISEDKFSRYEAPVDSILITDSPFANKPHNLNYNVNYSFADDSSRNELLLLATFTPVRRRLQQYFPSALLNSEGDTLRVPASYRSTNSYSFDIWVAQLDYSHAFRKQWRLEAGLKYQHTDSRQTIAFETEEAGNFISQPDRSSNNHLTETILGGYSIMSKGWAKDKLQLGLRLENTQVSYVGYYKLNYLQAFPTLQYQHSFDDAKEVSFSYRRTINRVPYDELVPYTLYINQYTIFQGNPLLKPQYDNTLSLNTRLSQLNIDVVYTSSKGMFAQLPIRQDLETKVTYTALQNLDKASNFVVNVSYPLQLTSWWNTENSGTLFGWSSATGQVLGQPFTLSGAWVALLSNQAIKLSPGVTLELSGYYRSSRKSELTYTGNNGNISAGLLINLLKGKGQLRIGAEEILERNTYYTRHDFTVFSTQRYRSFDSRRVSVGLSINLGQAKIKTPVKKLGNEEAVERF